MWVVIKYKHNEINIVKKNLISLFGKDLKIYLPQISYKKVFNQKFKYIEKNILGDYLFLLLSKFFSNKAFLIF